jgi:hypothetical protein
MAISDFNNDGFSDIQWYNRNTFEVGIWSINNGAIAGWTPQADFPRMEWVRMANGDYDADGFADTLWRSGVSGELGWWNIDAGAVQSWNSFGVVSPYSPSAGERSDFTGVGSDDILFFQGPRLRDRGRLLGHAEWRHCELDIVWHRRKFLPNPWHGRFRRGRPRRRPVVQCRHARGRLLGSRQRCDLELDVLRRRAGELVPDAHRRFHERRVRRRPLADGTSSTSGTTPGTARTIFSGRTPDVPFISS